MVTEAWKQTMRDGVKHKDSAKHDDVVKKEIKAYNERFHRNMDPKIFKAVLFAESGGPKNAAYNQRAMQIGNPGDPGIKVLKNGDEGSDMIMSAELKGDIKAKNIDDPILNIRAGIAFIITKHTNISKKEVVDEKGPVQEHTVAAGESLDKIAAKKGTTVAEIKRTSKLQGTMIHPKQKLKFHSAQMKRFVDDFDEITPKSLQEKYNGNGDPEYAEKIKFVMSILPSLSSDTPATKSP